MRMPLLQDLAVWAITSALAIAGAKFGAYFIAPDQQTPLCESLAHYDGYNYADIAENGYAYVPGEASNVAFFPAFPLASRWVHRITGLSLFPAMVLISNLSGALAFIVAGAYLRLRPQLGCIRHSTSLPSNGTDSDANGYVLLAMGLLPATFFLRMAYTESTFLLLCVLTLYGLSSRWPVVPLALTVGLATAVRPVGVALLLPLAGYIVQSSGITMRSAQRLAWALPLACWGLAAYMVFQGVEFHQPFAFAITQEYHRVRPPGAFADKLLSLFSWEPLWDAYDRGSPGYWQALTHMSCGLFSLSFLNPIYLCATAALVAWGTWKRLLTGYEILLAVPLIVMPYLTRAYEMRMLSQSRFMVVVFPAYIVLGHLLSRLPRLVACSALAFFGFLMGSLAALFPAGHMSI